jgi:hypothetical protein
MTAESAGAPRDEREVALEIAERWKDTPRNTFPPDSIFGILSRALLARSETAPWPQDGRCEKPCEHCMPPCPLAGTSNAGPTATIVPTTNAGPTASTARCVVVAPEAVRQAQRHLTAPNGSLPTYSEIRCMAAELLRIHERPLPQEKNNG